MAETRRDEAARETSPETRDAELLDAMRAADLTTRHLREYADAKQEGRTGGAASRYAGCTMVEAILLWWESGVRDEVLRSAKHDAQSPTPAVDGATPATQEGA